MASTRLTNGLRVQVLVGFLLLLQTWLLPTCLVIRPRTRTSRQSKCIFDLGGLVGAHSHPTMPARESGSGGSVRGTGPPTHPTVRGLDCPTVPGSAPPASQSTVSMLRGRTEHGRSWLLLLILTRAAREHSVDQQPPTPRDLLVRSRFCTLVRPPPCPKLISSMPVNVIRAGREPDVRPGQPESPCFFNHFHSPFSSE